MKITRKDIEGKFDLTEEALTRDLNTTERKGGSMTNKSLPIELKDVQVIPDDCEVQMFGSQLRELLKLQEIQAKKQEREKILEEVEKIRYKLLSDEGGRMSKEEPGAMYENDPYNLGYNQGLDDVLNQLKEKESV